MENNSLSSKINRSMNSHLDDEINFREILRTLMRHKALIFSITTITLIFSGINALTRKPIWEGQFEIVVASNQAPSSQVSQLLQTNPGLSKLIGTKGTNNKLATQVKILESPSVLKPVFEYVKDQKKLGGLDVEGWRYRDFDESVKVDLYKRTSYLYCQ